jgi:hypothetical protein
MKMGDTALDCNHIRAKIQEAEQFRKAAENNKGVTGTDTAAVLLF